MGNPKCQIISATATNRTLNVRVALYDAEGLLLTDKIYDSLESNGSHTEEQLLEFAKRKSILYLQALGIQQKVIDDKLKNLPEFIEITPEDLAKSDPMVISGRAKK